MYASKLREKQQLWVNNMQVHVLAVFSLVIQTNGDADDTCQQAFSQSHSLLERCLLN